MIKGAIFDIDGTLLDSMPIWENAGARYLATLGIKAKPDLKERLDALSLPEGAIYMQKEYGLSVSAEDILEGVNQVVKDFYYKEAVMKPGAYALVKRLKENGVKLIIATATDKEMAKAALIRNDIWQDFTGMITCEEAGAGKTSPKVFEFARHPPQPACRRQSHLHRRDFLRGYGRQDPAWRAFSDTPPCHRRRHCPPPAPAAPAQSGPAKRPDTGAAAAGGCRSRPPP